MAVFLALLSFFLIGQTAARDDDVIAFTGVRWGPASVATSIYTMRADGTGQRKIATGGTAPAWTRDGRRIAYGRMTAAGWRIWTAGADGSGARPITRYLGLADSPTWSPDDKRIAFEWLGLLKDMPKTGSYAQQIFVVPSSGGKLRQLTPFSRFKGGASGPAWSPDGKHIVFTGAESSAESSRADIWIMRPDGSGQRRLIRNGYDPAWSPDGKRVAFARNGDIYTAAASGRDVKRVTSTKATGESEPTWSPDGMRIAAASMHRYRNQANDDMRLLVIGADGRGAHLITDRDPGFWADAPAFKPGS